MADGPRCKRRKQANPRRNNVTNYNNRLEAGSDTDDEDKLHIVEEADGAECDGALPDEEHPREHCWDRVKEEPLSEPLSELEDERSTDALVEEMLQQGDTAVIYPEAPDDELPRLGTPEAGGPDENGAPDSFSQLLTCPFCARGYKRYSSLKEHIKYRHEKSEDSFNCPECSYSFAHRAQLERHMAAHKTGRDQRHIPQSAGNRKFKCTECDKAFKYKHHLKEHLRIHSGEKPYECSNCKKRFSHSGSYSSHISSKKCISVVSALNGRPRATAVPHAKSQGPASAAPSPPSSLLRAQIRDKLEPLQEQLPLSQIKSEPADYEYKAAGALPLQGTVQAVVLPTVGLVSPISINIADLQNALKVAVDGNVIRQVLEGKGQGLTAGATFHAPLPTQQQLISAISLPIVGQDGNAKIIINYSLDPSQAQMAVQNLKKEPMSPNEKLPEDLTVKVKGAREDVKEEKEQSSYRSPEQEGRTTNSCLLCEHCPTGLEALHALKHGKRLNGVDKSESTIASLLSESGLCTQPKNMLSLLKDYYATNAEPTKDELAKISDSVSLPEHVVQKWFDKMRQQGALGAPTPPSEEEDSVVSLVPGKDTASMSPSVSQDSPTEATPAEVSHSSPASPSTPLNLTATSDQHAPLDLSLPKSGSSPRAKTCPAPSPSSAAVPEEPLNLSCMKKESVSVVMPALVAIAEQGRGVQCLRALGSGGKRTILIPQLGYSYSPAATSPAGTETHEAAIQLNGIKEERPDSEGHSAADEQDSDYGPGRKKMKKTDSGMYACDLCDKIFQKSSSLLRHKYEHTGKRPHECGICAKAFKHKHHLIEHMRLHSGEKPYQCDKCGKRFSHSGSYSQHMNHRYSYCKRDTAGTGQAGGTPPGVTDRGAEEEELEENLGPEQLQIAPFHTDSDERGSEEDEDEDGAVDLEDIRVVQVEEDGTEEEEEEDSRQDKMETEEGASEEAEEDTHEEAEQGATEGAEEGASEGAERDVSEEAEEGASEEAEGGASEEVEGDATKVDADRGEASED